MRLGHVVLHSCVRAHKMAWLLKDRGHSIHLFTERLIAAHGWRDFDSVNMIYTGYLDWKQPATDLLTATIKWAAQGLDVVHYHNEPDWPVMVLKNATDKPLVYDIHDMVSMRDPSEAQFETEALKGCDAIVVPSRRYVEVLQARGITKPIEEILSCVPKKLFPVERRVPFRTGIVYEGGLKGKPKEQSEQFEFRSWAGAFTALSKLDVPVYAYPADGSENFEEYAQSGIVVMSPLVYDQLLKNLTAHEIGIVGSPFPAKAFDGALPNKLFEYIAAGLPVIALNAPTAAEFIEACGFGYGVNSLQEIPEMIERIRDEQIERHVWEERWNWTMERQVERLEALYQKIV